MYIIYSVYVPIYLLHTIAGSRHNNNIMSNGRMFRTTTTAKKKKLPFPPRRRRRRAVIFSSRRRRFIARVVCSPLYRARFLAIESSLTRRDPAVVFPREPQTTGHHRGFFTPIPLRARTVVRSRARSWTGAEAAAAAAAEAVRRRCTSPRRRLRRFLRRHRGRASCTVYV